MLCTHTLRQRTISDAQMKNKNKNNQTTKRYSNWMYCVFSTQLFGTFTPMWFFVLHRFAPFEATTRTSIGLYAVYFVRIPCFCFAYFEWSIIYWQCDGFSINRNNRLQTFWIWFKEFNVKLRSNNLISIILNILQLLWT